MICNTETKAGPDGIATPPKSAPFGSPTLTAALSTLQSVAKETFKSAAKEETTLVVRIGMATADYLFWFVEANGSLPSMKDIRKNVKEAVPQTDRTNKVNTFDNIITLGMKCGFLVYRSAVTSFRVMYVTSTGGGVEPAELKVDGTPKAKGAYRAVVYNLATVFPHSKVKVGTEYAPVANPATRPNGKEWIAIASGPAIDAAFSHFVEGKERDCYGKPTAAKRDGAQGGKGEAVSVRLTDATEREITAGFLTMLRDKSRLFKAVDTYAEMVDTLLEIATELDMHLTVDGDFKREKREDDGSVFQALAA